MGPFSTATAARMTLRKPLIIGVGNLLRPHDGMECRAAELLALRVPDAQFEECHQLTPELAPALANRLVIFLDAAVDQEPGSVRSRNVDRGRHSFSHHLSPGVLVELAAVINAGASTPFLISGGVFQTGFGDGLATKGERCAQRMAELLRKYCSAGIRGHFKLCSDSLEIHCVYDRYLGPKWR